MVLTRDVREEIESAVNQAVSKSIKSDFLIDQIVSKVTEAIIKTIDHKLLKMESTVAELEQNFAILNEKFENKFKTMEDEMKTTVRMKNKMEDRIDQMDQATRVCNLRIFSLKEKTNENTREEVKKILNTKMSLNLADQDISICYRIGKRVENKPRGIFMKLSNLESKQAIYEKKKLLKGTGVVIREDLTGPRVKQLNTAIEKFGIKNVWTLNGKIYINKNNKVYIIKNREDFTNILRQLDVN
ncbi:unnamed protein product [Phaedon cochleariae]|uniref:Uncharacterized protein n=1 Tax=Phaedon cochleariae TaxID=80249 RepID=A0A9P0GVN2_PHACE|nr:unnamed protein product [Phaedon cochleariae]